MRRLIPLLIIGILVIVFAAALQPAPSRSAAFMTRAKLTYDAIRRCQTAGKAAYDVAVLEAKLDLDTLDRLANSQAEYNTATILRNYLLQARLLRIDNHDTKINREFQRAYNDATLVIH